MQALIEKMTENLQVIYRKAIDADEALNQLQQQGKGKFNTIFASNTGFTTRSKRFKPYVEELAQRITTLPNIEQSAFEKEVGEIVLQMETLLTTLGQFKQTL